MGDSKDWLAARKRRKALFIKIQKIFGGSLIAALIVGPLIYFSVCAEPTVAPGEIPEEVLHEAPATPEPKVRISDKPIPFPEKPERPEIIKDDLELFIKSEKVTTKLRAKVEELQEVEDVQTALVEEIPEEEIQNLKRVLAGPEAEVKKIKKEIEETTEELLVLEKAEIRTGPKEVKNKQDADTVARIALQNYLQTIEGGENFAVLKDTSKLEQTRKPEVLVLSDLKNHAGKWYVTFQQYHNTLPVFDGNVKMIFTEQKKLLVITNNIKTLLPDESEFRVGTALARESVKELFEWDESLDEVDFINKGYFKQKPAYKVGVEAHNPLGNWEVYIDGVNAEIEEVVTDIRLQDAATPEPEIVEPATPAPVVTPVSVPITIEEATEEPEIIILEDFFSQILGKIFPKTPDEEPVIEPFKDEYAYIDQTQFITDDQGYFQNNERNWYSTFLDGPYVTVHDDDATSNVEIRDETPEDPFTWDENSASLAAINAFYHTNKIHEYFADNHDFNLDKNIPLTVNSHLVDAYIDGCGAWFNNTEKTIEMGRGGTQSCPEELNYALSSDLVYHEYTHFAVEEITHLPNIPGAEAAAMGEGLADYFAATINNDPVFADVVAPNRTRNLENELYYEFDMTGNSHQDGRIFSGALWDLREEIGAGKTDRLVFNTLFQDRLHFETFMYGMIIEDDDNNDFSDGTPHLIPIISAFEKHGIGPGVEDFQGLPITPEEWSKILEEQYPEGEEEPLMGAWSGDCSWSGSPDISALTVPAGGVCTLTGSGSATSVTIERGDTVNPDGGILYIGTAGTGGQFTVSSGITVQGCSTNCGSGGGFFLRRDSVTPYTDSWVSIGGNLIVYSGTTDGGEAFINGRGTTASTANAVYVYGTGVVNQYRETFDVGTLYLRNGGDASVNNSGATFDVDTFTNGGGGYSGGTFTAASNGTLTVNTTATIDNGEIDANSTVNLPNTTLNNNGHLDIISGTTTVGTLTMNDNSYVDLNGGTLNPTLIYMYDDSDIDQDGGSCTPSTLYMYDNDDDGGTTVDVAGTGTFTAAVDIDIRNLSTFTNNNTVTVNDDLLISQSAEFHNDNQLNVNDDITMNGDSALDYALLDNTGTVTHNGSTSETFYMYNYSQVTNTGTISLDQSVSGDGYLLMYQSASFTNNGGTLNARYLYIGYSVATNEGGVFNNESSGDVNISEIAHLYRGVFNNGSATDKTGTFDVGTGVVTGTMELQGTSTTSGDKGYFNNYSTAGADEVYIYEYGDMVIRDEATFTADTSIDVYYQSGVNGVLQVFANGTVPEGTLNVPTLNIGLDGSSLYGGHVQTQGTINATTINIEELGRLQVAAIGQGDPPTIYSFGSVSTTNISNYGGKIFNYNVITATGTIVNNAGRIGTTTEPGYIRNKYRITCNKLWVGDPLDSTQKQGGYVEHDSATGFFRVNAAASDAAKVHVESSSCGAGTYDCGKIHNQAGLFRVTNGRLVIDGFSTYDAEIINDDQMDIYQMLIQDYSVINNNADFNFSNVIRFENTSGGKVFNNESGGTFDGPTLELQRNSTFNNKSGADANVTTSTNLYRYANATINNNTTFDTLVLNIGNQSLTYDGGTFNNNSGGTLTVTDTTSGAAQVYGGALDVNNNSNGIDVAGTLTIGGPSTDQGVADFNALVYPDYSSTIGDLVISNYGWLRTDQDIAIDDSGSGTGSVTLSGIDDTHRGLLQIDGSSVFRVDGTTTINGYGELQNNSSGWFAARGFNATGTTTVNTNGFITSDASSYFDFNNDLTVDGGTAEIDDDADGINMIVENDDALVTLGLSSNVNVGNVYFSGTLTMNPGTTSTHNPELYNYSQFTVDGVVNIGDGTGYGPFFYNYANDDSVDTSFARFRSASGVNVNLGAVESDTYWDIYHDLTMTNSSQVLLEDDASDSYCATDIGVNGGSGDLLVSYGTQLTHKCTRSAALLHELRVQDYSYIYGIVTLDSHMQTEDMIIGEAAQPTQNAWIVHSIMTSESGNQDPAIVFDLEVSNNLTINSNGNVNVDARSDISTTCTTPPCAGTFGGIGQTADTTGATSFIYGEMDEINYYYGRGGRLVGDQNVTNGGGKVFIYIGNVFTQNGSISANGEDDPTYYVAGSGGSINLVIDGTITGSGTIAANGGASTSGSTQASSFGGGGGRIYISYADYITFHSFSGTIQAIGGANERSTVTYGGTGTIFLDSDDMYENLRQNLVGSFVYEFNYGGTLIIDSNNNDVDVDVDGNTPQSSTTDLVDYTFTTEDLYLASLQVDRKGAFFFDRSYDFYLYQCIDPVSAYNTRTYVDTGAVINYNPNSTSPPTDTVCHATPDPPKTLHINLSDTGTSSGYEGEKDDTVPGVADLTPDVSAIHQDGRLNRNGTIIDSPTDDAEMYNLQIHDDLFELWADVDGSVVLCDVTDTFSTPLTDNDSTRTDIEVPYTGCGEYLAGGNTYYWRIRYLENLTLFAGDEFWGLWSLTNTFDLDEGGTITVGVCGGGGNDIILNLDMDTSTYFDEDLCSVNVDSTADVNITAHKDAALTRTASPSGTFPDMNTNDNYLDGLLDYDLAKHVAEAAFRLDDIGGPELYAVLDQNQGDGLAYDDEVCPGPPFTGSDPCWHELQTGSGSTNNTIMSSAPDPVVDEKFKFYFGAYVSLPSLDTIYNTMAGTYTAITTLTLWSNP